MTTAICIPAERPQFFERIVTNIAETTQDYNLYWVVGTDVAARELDRLHQDFWQDEGDISWGVRANFMYSQTVEEYLFIGSDDSLWHHGWLTAALDAMYPIDGAVIVRDGYNPSGTLPLVSRRYIETMSGCIDEPNVIFHSGYRHAYVETELRETAQHRGKYAYCPDSYVEHLHFGAGKADHDEVYAIGEASCIPGAALFASRRHLWTD